MRITFIREHLITHTKLATTSLSSIRYHKKYHQRSFGLDLQLLTTNAYATGSFDTGVDGVNNMNTMPMENIAFDQNQLDWTAVDKKILPRPVKRDLWGKSEASLAEYVPIPGDSITLNASDLLSQAQAEQTTLREELNKQLDEMLYAKIAETDKAMTDNMDSIVGKTPLKIFVG